jgi:hypothetical protein
MCIGLARRRRVAGVGRVKKQKEVKDHILVQNLKINHFACWIAVP